MQKLLALILVVLVSFVSDAQTANTDSAKQTPSSMTITPTAPETIQTIEFIKKTELAGDFRYRFQFVDTPTSEQQRVNRIMFRIGQTFQVQEDLKIAYRLLTGTEANSGNVTLGADTKQGSQRQTVGLDLAYAQYGPAKDLNLYIGKHPQFFYFPGKNQMILDRDITLEGGGLQYKFSVTEDFTAGLNVSSSWIREKYTAATGQDLNDSMLTTAQLNLGYKFSDFQFLVGYGMFNYSDIENNQPAQLYASATSAKGNTLTGANYKNGYEISQIYAEVKWQQKPFDISLFGEFDQNNGADTLNKASVVGLGLTWDKWGFTYMVQKIEKDAVLALFTDSDFAGGQVNSDGSIIGVNYKINKNAALTLTHFINRLAIDTTPTDYTRTHADLTFSF